MLRRLAELKAEVLELGARIGLVEPARALKLRHGLIQAAVLEVLGSHGALRTKDIHVLVEQRLGVVVNSATVYSYLSVASRDERSGVRKVGYGRYESG